MLRILYRKAPDEQVSRDRRLEMIDLLKSYEEKGVLRFCLADEFPGEWAGDLVKWVLTCKTYKVLVPVLGDLICSKILCLGSACKLIVLIAAKAKVCSFFDLL